VPDVPVRATELGAVVDALLGLGRELDAVSIAEILWLAGRGDGFSPVGAETDEDSGLSAGSGPEQETGAPREEPGRAAEPRTPLHEPWQAGAGLPGRRVSLPRAAALPRGRDLARALKPLKRPWRHGRRQRLDIAATVSDYTRSGELIPVFSDAPERWFDATLVIDGSPTMAVWTDTAEELQRVISRTGVFRTMRVRELYTSEIPGRGPKLHGPLGQPTAEGGLRSAGPRSLMLVLSDCASAGWRDGTQWQRLRTWADATPTALINPLPSKMWRHAGLDLPAARVTSPGVPGAANARLRYSATLLLDEAFPAADRRGWLPVPVLSLSPYAFGSWARTLMRSDPAGCEAVLVPAPGPGEQAPVTGGVEPPDDRTLTDAYLLRASPAAVRLAMLCSMYPQVNLDVLRLVQRELVPDASPADLAEFVVGGLVTVTEGGTQRGHPVLRFREGARELLMGRLGARDAHRVEDAVDGFMQANSASSDRFPAVVGGGADGTGVSASRDPFAAVSAGTLRAQGMAVDAPDLPRKKAAPPPRRVTTRPRTARTAAGRPYFFLSYAHTPIADPDVPDPDLWVTRLYQDLSAHVLSLTDLAADTPAGFMDRDIRTGGQDWSEQLSDALGNCRVFVPLMSPRYFASEMCGKEWSAFAQRQVRPYTRSVLMDRAIVPALWVPVLSTRLPAVAAQLQFDHARLGEPYVKEGLYGLMKLNRFRGAYETAVHELAKRVVAVAESVSVEPGPPLDYRRIPSAFSSPRGERRLRITVVSTARDRLATGRSPDYYGPRAEDWNPFHPDSSRPLADFAAALFRGLGYDTEVRSFPDRPGPPVDIAPAPGPEIVLVDGWTVNAPGWRRWLHEFAATRPWACWIVAWHRSDAQSNAMERELNGHVGGLLPEPALAGPPGPRVAAGVHSLDVLTDLLPPMAEWSAQEYARHAPDAQPDSGR
jgi:FxsC-like protein